MAAIQRKLSPHLKICADIENWKTRFTIIGSSEGFQSRVPTGGLDVDKDGKVVALTSTEVVVFSSKSRQLITRFGEDLFNDRGDTPRAVAIHPNGTIFVITKTVILCWG